MATTANGHEVIFESRTDGPLPRLRKFNIPGTGRHLFLRDGSMGFILAWIAVWFDRKIERLDIIGDLWDEWGWAVRPQRGQTTGYSEHSGGSAEDLNATRHPRGIPANRTLTTAQIRRIKRKMVVLGGVVIWGGEWRTPDAMHFEIGKVSLRRCELLAKVLMKTKRGKKILDANPGLKEVIKS